MTLRQTWARRSTRHLKWFGPAAAPLVVLLAIALSPTVRTQVRASFTRLPSEYTELYFSSPPALTQSGTRAVIHAPVALVHHGATTKSFTLRTTVTATTGGVGSTAEMSLSGAPGQVAPAVFTFQVPAAAPAYLVDVALSGHPQTLHFRLSRTDPR